LGLPPKNIKEIFFMNDPNEDTRSYEQVMESLENMKIEKPEVNKVLCK
jgi:hypothetical protein